MTASSERPTNRILIISHDRVGVRMAGQGIRFWEIARALSKEFDTKLAVPGGASLLEPRLEIVAYEPGNLTVLKALAQDWADVVICSGFLVRSMTFLRELAVPLVVDVNVPVALESLAQNASQDSVRQMEAYRHSWDVTRMAAQYADLLICPGERQRDYWLGVLAAQGRLRQELYSADPDLRNLIDTVSFGCPTEPPQPGPAIKGVVPGIEPHDCVILWGGGIWNWFDPLTLLQALPQIIERHPDARLVFMGPDHPDKSLVPQMERARQARSLSQEMGLNGQFVFWGDWAPYAERGAYLLDADIGVSLHHASVETRLAFRTRLLDAIWANLPMVMTRGDVLATEFEERGLGYGVDAGAVDQVVQAVTAILDEPNPKALRQSAFDVLKEKYDWDRCTEPLKRFCKEPYFGAGKRKAIDLTEENGIREREALQSEIARLQEVVHGYESGRLMRALAAFHSVRERLLGD